MKSPVDRDSAEPENIAVVGPVVLEPDCVNLLPSFLSQPGEQLLSQLQKPCLS